MSDQLAHYRDRAATALSAFLARSLHGNADLAIQAAQQAIDKYSPRTPREVQLSAQIVACGFAALACLRSAVAGQKLPPKTILRLQGNALKLDKHAQACTKALEAKQRERQRAPQVMTSDSVAWDAASFDTMIGVALANMLEADSHIADVLAKTMPIAAGPRLQAVPAAKPAPKMKLTMGMPMTMDVLNFRAGLPDVKPAIKRRLAS